VNVQRHKNEETNISCQNNGPVTMSFEDDLRDVFESLRQLFRDGVFASVLVLLIAANVHDAKPKDDTFDA